MDIPERIEVRGDEELVITWPGGSTSSFTAAELRAACPCASCREAARLGGRPAPLAGGASGARIQEARLVGDYAVALTFGPDGHRTGIFTFELLRRLGA